MSSLYTIHLRHHMVHQDDIEVFLLKHFYCFPCTQCGRASDTYGIEQTFRDGYIYPVVVDYQDLRFGCREIDRKTLGLRSMRLSIEVIEYEHHVKRSFRSAKDPEI